jgi:hypothetical protein
MILLYLPNEVTTATVPCATVLSDNKRMIKNMNPRKMKASITELLNINGNVDATYKK